jgi:hypothetical protein
MSLVERIVGESANCNSFKAGEQKGELASILYAFEVTDATDYSIHTVLLASTPHTVATTYLYIHVQ